MVAETLVKRLAVITIFPDGGLNIQEEGRFIVLPSTSLSVTALLQCQATSFHVGNRSLCPWKTRKGQEGLGLLGTPGTADLSRAARALRCYTALDHHGRRHPQFSIIFKDMLQQPPLMKFSKFRSIKLIACITSGTDL